MPKKKTLILNNYTLQGMDKLNQKYGWTMFVYTLNGFFIDSGISPDVPTGFAKGVYRINGIWQPGAKYTQYEPWEKRMSQIFGEFKKWEN